MVEPAKIKVNKSETFVQKARIVHGERYDYTEVVYVNNETAIWITCIEHGERFLQVPKNHLRGSTGCRQCPGPGGVKRTAHGPDLVARGLAKYNNKYDYSLVGDIKTTRDNIDVICTVCQAEDADYKPFSTSFNTHLKPDSSGGCPSCAQKNKSKPRGPRK